MVRLRGLTGGTLWNIQERTATRPLTVELFERSSPPLEPCETKAPEPRASLGGQQSRLTLRCRPYPPLNPALRNENHGA